MQKKKAKSKPLELKTIFLNMSCVMHRYRLPLPQLMVNIDPILYLHNPNILNTCMKEFGVKEKLQK